MKRDRTSLALHVLTLTLGWIPTVSQAQIVPDSSLPVNSIVAPNGNIFTIDGGTQAGGNLFHSFQDFSLPTGTEAFFNNSLDVQNIFSRVTGGNISNIDGLIGANGSANLFLLNPAGIVFGPNASLNLGGSFFGTTAESIRFADGVEFSAQNPQAPPLLTVNVPIGLQMGQNLGGITVQGQGNQLTDSTGFGTANASQSPVGLQPGADRTLALIGSGINFSGGVASTRGSGHLELGSVSTGTVGLKTTPTGWLGNYSAVSQFNDIHLAQQSMLNASGSHGSIQLQGQNISLTEGSAALLQNLGAQPSGEITVNATGSLSLAGNTANGQLGSLIQSNNFGTGQVGNLIVSAAALSLQDGARIVTRTRTETVGAHIIANVGGTTEIAGFNRSNPAIYSAIVTFSLNSGDAGNITVSTENLRIVDSGEIISVAVSSGQSGAIQVNAADLVEIAGHNPMSFTGSGLSTFTQGSGDANRAVINTSKLVIQEGGSLGSTASASGSAGDVIVNASESIDIVGRVTQGFAAGLPARIFSNAEISDPATQAAFQLPPIPTGNSGSLTINTPLLRLIDGGSVSVENQGSGIAGNVQINANSIVQDNQGSITASTASGAGGDIRLNLQEHLQMRHHSLISATAGGTGDGGNITIDSPTIVGLENSDIVANAVQGKGGNIQITTQGIFGLENRPQQTDESDITASSQFGVSGNITITNPEVDPSSSLVNLSQEVVDPTEQVIAGCQWTADSEFIATGRSGVPANPNRPLSSSRTWSDVRDLSEFRGETVEAAAAPTETPKPLVEATGWVVNEDGTVELVATANSPRSGNFGASECNPVRNGDRVSAEIP